MKLARLLNMPYIDERLLNERIEYKKPKKTTDHNLEVPSQLALSLVFLFDKNIDAGVPSDFFEKLQSNVCEIEPFVLDILYYRDNSDSGEFSKLNTFEKINDFLRGFENDLECYNMFDSYLQTRDIVSLVKIYCS